MLVDDNELLLEELDDVHKDNDVELHNDVLEEIKEILLIEEQIEVQLLKERDVDKLSEEELEQELEKQVEIEEDELYEKEEQDDRHEKILLLMLEEVLQ